MSHRRGVQLSSRHKRWFYSVSVLLFLSGALWKLFGWAADHDEARAETFRSLRPWMLKLHGASAMAFFVELGILIPTHIRRAWNANRNRANGAVLVAIIAVLVLTGYGLYYLGDEQWRSYSSITHLVLGLLTPFALALHIWQGRRDDH
jgi:cation transport ATPase